MIKKKIYFIFFSSEYVYSGKKGNYKESDLASPINEYGKQKLKVEKYIVNHYNNCAIFRIAKTYSNNLNDNTLISVFLKKIIKGERNFSFAIDQKFNPLYLGDLKKITKLFLKKKIKGVFNVGGNLKLSRYDFYQKLIKLLSKNLIIAKKTKLKYFNFLDGRPLNNTLNIDKLNKLFKQNKKRIEIVAKQLINKSKLYDKIS